MKTAMSLLFILGAYCAASRFDMQEAERLTVEAKVLESVADIGMEHYEHHRVAVLTLEPECK